MRNSCLQRSLRSRMENFNYARIYKIIQYPPRVQRVYERCSPRLDETQKFDRLHARQPIRSVWLVQAAHTRTRAKPRVHRRSLSALVCAKIVVGTNSKALTRYPQIVWDRAWSERTFSGRSMCRCRRAKRCRYRRIIAYTFTERHVVDDFPGKPNDRENKKRNDDNRPTIHNRLRSRDFNGGVPSADDQDDTARPTDVSTRRSSVL